MKEKIEKVLNFMVFALQVFEELEHTPEMRDYSLAVENLQDQCRKMIARLKLIKLRLEESNNG